MGQVSVHLAMYAHFLANLFLVNVAPILNNIPIFATCIVPTPATCGKGLKGNRV